MPLRMDQKQTEEDLRALRTIYVGNVQPNMDEADIRQFFQAQFAAVDRRRGFINKVSVNHSRYFAFVDFASSADADMAMRFDGAVLRGFEMRIKRPNIVTPASNEDDIADLGSGKLSLGPSAQRRLKQRFEAIQQKYNEEEYDY
jgi:RNA recognition motif-containing protein